MIKTGLLASPLIDLDAMLEWEASAIAMIFQTEDLRESFAAFREKRDPVVQGPLSAAREAAVRLRPSCGPARFLPPDFDGAEPFVSNSSRPGGSGASWLRCPGLWVARSQARPATTKSAYAFAISVADELAARPVPVVDPVHHPEDRDRGELRLDVGADDPLVLP